MGRLWRAPKKKSHMKWSYDKFGKQRRPSVPVVPRTTTPVEHGVGDGADGGSDDGVDGSFASHADMVR